MAGRDHEPAGQAQEVESGWLEGVFVGGKLPPTSSSPPLPAPRYRNKYGGCAYFEFFMEREEQNFRLGAHFTFGEHKMVIHRPNEVFTFVTERWLLRFGVKGGDLEFNLNNLRSPLAERKFVRKFPTEVKVKISREKNTSSNSQRDGSITANAIPLGASAQMRLLRTSDAKGSEKQEFEDCVFTIHSTGDETNPQWSFRSKSDDKILRGGLTGAILATLRKIAAPVAFVGWFNIMQSDIRVTDVDGVDELCDRKKADLWLRLRKFVFQKTGSSLCEVEWTADHAHRE